MKTAVPRENGAERQQGPQLNRLHLSVTKGHLESGHKVP